MSAAAKLLHDDLNVDFIYGSGTDIGLAHVLGADKACSYSLDIKELIGRLCTDYGRRINALTIKGITGRRMWETWYQMEQMLLGGLDLSPVITHRFQFEDFQKGFDVMVSGQCGKVLLEW